MPKVPTTYCVSPGHVPESTKRRTRRERRPPAVVASAQANQTEAARQGLGREVSDETLGFASGRSFPLSDGVAKDRLELRTDRPCALGGVDLDRLDRELVELRTSLRRPVHLQESLRPPN